MLLPSYGQCEDVAITEDFEKLPKQIIEHFQKHSISNFNFIDSDGNTFSMGSMEGKIIAINYWSFSCKPCIDEIPKLNLIVEKYKSKVHFLSILPPGKFNIQSESLQKKIEALSFDYQHVAMTECFSDVFKVPMIFPTHIIIGRDGRFLDLFFGTDLDRLEKQIVNNI